MNMNQHICFHHTRYQYIFKLISITERVCCSQNSVITLKTESVKVNKRIKTLMKKIKCKKGAVYTKKLCDTLTDFFTFPISLR